MYNFSHIKMIKKNWGTFWKRIALVMFGSCVGWEDTADQDDN